MKKNTRTTFSELQIGDRFYIKGDADNKMWSKVEHRSDLSHWQHHKDWALRDAGRHPLAMKPTTEVIFLRHVSREIIDSDLLLWK